jgi:hypothetical protein
MENDTYGSCTSRVAKCGWVGMPDNGRCWDSPPSVESVRRGYFDLVKLSLSETSERSREDIRRPVREPFHRPINVIDGG